MTGTNTMVISFDSEEEAYESVREMIDMFAETTGNYSVSSRKCEDGTVKGNLTKIIDQLNVKPDQTEFYIKNKYMGSIDSQLYKDKVKLSPELGFMADIFVDGKYGVVTIKEKVTTLYGLVGSHLVNRFVSDYTKNSKNPSKDFKKMIFKKAKKQKNWTF